MIALAVSALVGVIVGAVLAVWAALTFVAQLRSVLEVRIDSLEMELHAERAKPTTVTKPMNLNFTPEAIKALGAEIARSFATNPGRN